MPYCTVQYSYEYEYRVRAPRAVPSPPCSPYLKPCASPAQALSQLSQEWFPSPILRTIFPLPYVQKNGTYIAGMPLSLNFGCRGVFSRFFIIIRVVRVDSPTLPEHTTVRDKRRPGYVAEFPGTWSATSLWWLFMMFRVQTELFPYQHSKGYRYSYIHSGAASLDSNFGSWAHCNATIATVMHYTEHVLRPHPRGWRAG